MTVIDCAEAREYRKKRRQYLERELKKLDKVELEIKSKLKKVE